MSIEEPPEYSISEFLLGSLFFAAALVCLIWALGEFIGGRSYSAMKGAGLALIMFSGSVDPLRFYGDILSFPFRFVDSAGRDTSVTLFGAILGSILFTAGWILELLLKV